MNLKLAKSVKVEMNMLDLIEDGFGSEYDVNSFLNDYRFMVHTERDAAGYYEDEGDDGLLCDIDDCYVVQRSNRNKGRMTKHGNERKQLFFIWTDNEKDGESTKNMVIQQILDTAHLWLYHTLRIKAQKYLEDDHEDDDDDQNNIDLSCIDAAIQEFGKMANQIRASSNRFTSKQRERDGLCALNANKFKTNNQYENAGNVQVTTDDDDDDDDGSDAVAIYQSAVYGNDQMLFKKKQNQNQNKNTCFMDKLYSDFRGNGASNTAFSDFYEFIEAEEYETESVQQDLRNDPSSNILHKFTLKKKTNLFFKKFLFENDQKQMLYSAGYRFFYWPYYQNMNAQWNPLYVQSSGQPMVEGNEGYQIKDWFISSKYKDLKEEAIHNKLSPFSVSQFNDIHEKASLKLSNWFKDPEARKLRSQDNLREDNAWCEKVYGIKQGDVIKVEHIMALMFYTNFSEHSYLFSSTFRRSSPFETDAALKQRHREFHHWSRSLRECVECYGQMMVDSDVETFYHGVSASMLFDSTTIKLCGPLSTTAGLDISISVWCLFCIFCLSPFHRLFCGVDHLWSGGHRIKHNE